MNTNSLGSEDCSRARFKSHLDSLAFYEEIPVLESNRKAPDTSLLSNIVTVRHI